ncbi:hypothetical protein GCM10028798_32660 [Humibacter antri]
MRSTRPMPGNPWPHDMVITIEDTAHALLDLLWIRETWQLEPEGEDLPPVLVDTPTRVSPAQRAAAPIMEWQDAWPELWHSCLQHAGKPRDHESMALLHASPLASGERARLLRKLFGASWADRFGTDAFIAGHHQKWEEAFYERHRARVSRPYDESPEFVCLDALVPAWRAGLTKIVEIPCRGTFTHILGPHSLLVTVETRADPDRYREALALFAWQHPQRHPSG